jgi:hypothetical protein
MKHQINYADLKAGQKVWTIQSGDCEIKALVDGDAYEIKTDKDEVYTLDGKYSRHHAAPSIFLSNPFESEADTQTHDREVEVRNNEQSIWEQRVLHMIRDGDFICWGNAQTIEESKSSFNLAAWRYMREIPVKTILTKQEVAEKFGVDVENLEIR